MQPHMTGGSDLAISQQKVDFTSTDYVNIGGTKGYPLVKLHGQYN